MVAGNFTFQEPFRRKNNSFADWSTAQVLAKHSCVWSRCAGGPAWVAPGTPPCLSSLSAQKLPCSFPSASGWPLVSPGWKPGHLGNAESFLRVSEQEFPRLEAEPQAPRASGCQLTLEEQAGLTVAQWREARTGPKLRKRGSIYIRINALWG